VTAVLLPNGKQQYFTTAGLPAVGYKIATFDAGTSNPRTTWQDALKVATNTNPVILDARGEASIFWDGAYKVQLQDSTGAVIWTQDNLQSQPNNFSGSILPAVTNSFDLGSVTLSWRNIYVGANNAPVLDTASGNIGYYARTAAEIAAAVTPTLFVWPEGDIRRYGALTAAADNSGAFNNALKVSANGGNAAFIPPGTWKITSSVACILNCSMYGVGQLSVIAPQTCDGLTFTNQGTFYGERFFRDFVISGTTVTANKAMVALMTAASGNQVNGIEFSGIAVTGGFQYCVYGYGWNRCTWRSCYFLNNTNGFWFIEQSIKVSLRDCFVIKSPIATHGDGSTALNCDQLAGIRPQDITATGCFFYGHDIGVSFGNVLYAAIDNCDLDQTLSTCVAITTVNGGCRVRNCWLDTNSASATTGVLINALGAANNDLILIDGNYTLCTQANAGSVGISVGAQQKSVVVTSNTIGTPGAPFATGMSIAGNNCVGKFNNIYASTTAITVNSSTADVEIGPNNVQNGTALTFSSGTPPGFSYFARGSFTITLTGMTAVITGTVNWAANGHTVTLSVPSAGILGTSNTTAMTGTGLPQYLWPNADKTFPAAPVNSGVAGFGAGQVAAATGIITFFRDIAGTAFTNVGTKGLSGLDSTYSYA
jgi:hypothetical protein